MPQNPYLKVRWLPASDIAELWRREATTGNSKESIEAELRRFLYMKAIGHDWRSHGLIPEEEMPPLEDLPPASTAVRKSELKEFFQKQLTWPLPRFWFPEEALEARGRGRPSDKSETVKQFKQWVSEGRTWETKATCTRDLLEWMLDQGYSPVKVRTISRWIPEKTRGRYP